FFAGIAPALIALWLQRGLREPESWQAARSSKTTRSAAVSLAQLFRGPLAPSVLICATMNAATLFAWWGLFTWVPRFLSLPTAQGGRGLSIVSTSIWTVVMQIGTFLGYISFGFIADRFSHKRAYIAYLIVAAALVPVFAWIRNPDA